MKNSIRIDRHGFREGPNLLHECIDVNLLLDRVICHDVDGTPHTIGEFIWPWTAYTVRNQKLLFHFFYWKKGSAPIRHEMPGTTVDRVSRMRELQFLMTRQIWYGRQLSPYTLFERLRLLHRLASFAESRSCTVVEVLSSTKLIDAFGTGLQGHLVVAWIGWFDLLRQLDPEKQLGFSLAVPKRWKDLERKKRVYREKSRQFAPLPTRIYAELISNVAMELEEIKKYKVPLLAALREGIQIYRGLIPNFQMSRRDRAAIKKFDLEDFLLRRGYVQNGVRALGSVVTEIFILCKIQIHIFSGMRDEEARGLPFHCLEEEKSIHGRKHCLISGCTTKINAGRRLRTKWVTTESEGVDAVQLAQDFATVIYESLDIIPDESDHGKDDYPLFPTLGALPWNRRHSVFKIPIQAFSADLSQTEHRDRLVARLRPIIRNDDIVELEEIDPFRCWRDEPKFALGVPWPLSIHQLRRSLAIYANASGLVRLSSLRRQLQHLSREMALYYGRGSIFCKNFIETDPDEYKKHVAVDWQDGSEEAEMLAFVRDVLKSSEPMFGGAGVFYDRQRERGQIMAREEVAKQIKTGLLAYREGPLGGCTRPGPCNIPKGLNLIGTACATEGCKYLIGKHSNIVQAIRLKRAAMSHVTIGSITEAMELEELEALERVECEWRPDEQLIGVSLGNNHA